MGAAHMRASAQAPSCARRRARRALPTAPIPGCRQAQGLYDPALDKDSCGVGFIADIKGRKSHKLVEDALAILLQSRASRRGRRRSARRRRRRHPGADPAQVLRQEGRRARLHAAASPANTPSARCSCRAIRTGGRSIRDIYAQMIKREGMTLLGWRDVPTDNSTLGESVKPTEPVHLQVFIGRGKKIKSEDEFERRLYILRKSISNAIYTPQGAPAVRLLPGVDLLPHRHLQGHVPRRPARHLLSRPARSGFRERARARAPALLDQHLPDLVAGASLPDDRAQRRDQHAARQHQLDGGAPGVGVLRRCSATTSTSSGRSPTRASPTPPASTMRSNSWCRAATRSRTP